MVALIVAHRGNHFSRTAVPGRKARQVPVEVLLDLALGLREERDAPAIARQTGECADRECPRIPEGIQHALPAAEIAYALGAPREVVLLLFGRLLHGCAHSRAPGRDGLALVQR